MEIIEMESRLNELRILWICLQQVRHSWGGINEMEDGSEGNTHVEIKKDKEWKIKQGKKYKGLVEMF